MPNLFRLLSRSLEVFTRHPTTIVSIAAVYIPAAFVRVIDLGALSVPTQIATLAIALAVNGALIRAAAVYASGNRPGFTDSYRVALDAYWRLLEVIVRTFGAAFLLAITIVGIPFAVRLLVRWWFGSQAVIITEKNAKDSISFSCQIVTGRWWPIAGVVLLLLLDSYLLFVPLWLLLDPPQLMWALIISIWTVTITPVRTVFLTLMFLDLADRMTTGGPAQVHQIA